MSEHEHSQPTHQQTDEVVEHGTSPSEQPIADHVMDILSDVEQQLARLRAAQQEQDVEVATLSERAVMLESQEENLREQQVLIDRERDALAQLEQELTERQKQFAAQRDQYDAACADERQAIERMRADSESQLEAARVRASDAEQQQSLAAEHAAAAQEKMETIVQQQEALDAREEQLNTSLERLNRERDRIEAIEQACAEQVAAAEQAAGEGTKREQALEERLGEAAQESEAFRGQLAELQAALTTARQEKEQSEHDALEVAQAAEQQRDAARSEAAAMKERLSEFERRLTEREQELRDFEAGCKASAERERELQAQVTALQEQASAHADTSDALERAVERADAARAELDTLRESLADRDAVIRDHRDKLKMAGERLEAFAEAINEQANQIEKGAAAIVQVQQQRREIDRLREELATTRVGADPEVIKRKDDRIAQLTEALRQARGQTAGQTNVAELEQKVAEQEQVIDRLQLEVESATVEAKEARGLLEEQRDTEARTSTDHSRAAARLEQATAEVDRLEAALKEARRAAESDSRELRNVISELEARLDASEVSSSADASRELKLLKEKTRRIAEVATHLKRRKQRLRQLRRSLASSVGDKRPVPAAPAQSRAVNTAALEEHASNMRKLEDKRRELIEVRSVLAASERKMLRKWAQRRSIGSVAWVTVVVALTAAGSWVAADRFFPTVRNAVVEIKAQVPEGAPLTDADLVEWTIWHRKHITKDAFHSSLAQRMADRGLQQYDLPNEVRDRLKGQLAVDTQEPGRMILSLSGTNPADTKQVLDTLAATLARDSENLVGTRESRAVAHVVGGNKVDGRMRYASIDPVVVEDKRLLYAAIMFAVGCVLIGLLIAIFYTTLVKAKRVFDEDDPLIEPGVGLTAMA